MKPARFSRYAFSAWRICDGDKHAHAMQTFADTLPAIEREIASEGNYGATVLIVERDVMAEAKMLRAYRIRRGKWLGQIDPTTHARVYPYAADRLFSMPVAAFEPAEPWRWTPDNDGVDITRFDRARGVAL